MAADDDSLLNEDEGADSAPAKKGGLGGLLSGLLKWIALGLGAIILIVTVVIITNKITNKNGNQVAVMPISEEYRVEREVLDYYTSLEPIRTKTTDAIPANVVVKVVLGYKKEDKATSTEITQRNIQIIDFLRRYFTERTKKELSPQNEDRLKKDIKDRINDEILSSSRIKDVAFTQFDVIEQ